MIINNRPLNDDKNGEKKGDLSEPGYKSNAEGRAPGGAGDPIGSEAKPPGNGETDPPDAASHRARRILGEAQKRVQGRVHEARLHLAPLGNWVRESARTRPVQMMVATSGLGFLAGALMRRLASVGAAVTIGVLATYYLSRPTSEPPPIHPAAQN